MARAWTALLLAVMSLAASGPGRAQDLPSAAALTREDWKASVREQRARIDQMRREKRSFVPDPPSQEQLAAERVRQAFDDLALVAGDMIATPRGLYRYRGTPDNRTRQPEDFTLIEPPGRR